MDEIRKVPPITRLLVGSTIGISLGPLLKLINPYLFLLWWPAIIRNLQVWRVFSCFFLAGGGIQMLFDLFLLGRNVMDLETNAPFYRRTSDFVWALVVIGSLLLATNYPLQSTVLFNPMLMSFNYLWARNNANATVSLFGLVSCPASLLPYAYLFFDLLRGGPALVIQSATGLLSAHVYYYLTAVLPNTDGGRGPRLLSTPAFLRRLFPDSVDPANAAANAERDRGAGGAGAGGRVMSTGWGGTAFAPRGRQFGDGGHEWGTAAGDQQSRSAGSSGGSWSSWLPSVLRGGGVGRQGQTASSTSGPSQRQALLEATERRLRAQRDNSIAGRNAAASSSSSSSRPAAAAAPTPTMAGRPTTGTTGVRTGDSSESTLRSRTHGSANLGRLSNPRDRADDDEEEELDASSSGGAVAEERRPEDRKAAAAASNRAGSGANPPPSTEGRGGQQEQGHSWGQGQRLGE